MTLAICYFERINRIYAPQVTGVSSYRKYQKPINLTNGYDKGSFLFTGVWPITLHVYSNLALFASNCSITSNLSQCHVPDKYRADLCNIFLHLLRKFWKQRFVLLSVTRLLHLRALQWATGTPSSNRPGRVAQHNQVEAIISNSIQDRKRINLKANVIVKL